MSLGGKYYGSKLSFVREKKRNNVKYWVSVLEECLRQKDYEQRKENEEQRRKKASSSRLRRIDRDLK